MTELHELSNEELRWARTHWQHWSGAGNKYPTEAEWAEEFEARARARAWEESLRYGLPPSFLHPDWPLERRRHGALLDY